MKFMFATLGFALALFTSTDVTFVRHGETVANFTGKYNARTLNVFSEKGKAEVASLTEKLRRESRFDRILVSPSPRALRTIAPYLKATGQKATVWPLLYECCTGRRPKNARATSFKYGEKIAIPKDMAAYFKIELGHERLPNAPDYDSGLAQVAASLKEFGMLFKGGRVLLVGHSGHGGQFIHALTGKWKQVKNAEEIRFALP